MSTFNGKMRKQQPFSNRYNAHLLFLKYGSFVAASVVTYFSLARFHKLLFGTAMTTYLPHLSYSEQDLIVRVLGMNPSKSNHQCQLQSLFKGSSNTLPIPPASLRKGKSRFLSNEEYKTEAVELVHNIRLLIGVATQAATTVSSHSKADLAISPTIIPVTSFEDAVVMDYGCGSGRLLIGLLSANICFKKYIGVDVNIHEIQWLQRAFLSPPNGTRFFLSDTQRTKQQEQNAKSMEFIRVNVKNERYNEAGRPLDTDSVEIAETLIFPPTLSQALTGTVDIMILRSVFSHMLSADIYHHLHALYPLLKTKSGIMVVSLFLNTKPSSPVETVVSQESAHRGNHIVLISKQVFENIIYETGYRIRLYLAEWNVGEDVYVLSTDGKDPNDSSIVDYV